MDQILMGQIFVDQILMDQILMEQNYLFTVSAGDLNIFLR